MISTCATLRLGFIWPGSGIYTTGGKTDGGGGGKQRRVSGSGIFSTGEKGGGGGKGEYQAVEHTVLERGGGGGGGGKQGRVSGIGTYSTREKGEGVINKGENICIPCTLIPECRHSTHLYLNVYIPHTHT